MKLQNLYSGKKKKKYFKMSSAKIIIKSTNRLSFANLLILHFLGIKHEY